MVAHLFLTGWMLHIPSSLCYLLCSGYRERELFQSLIDQISYEDFSDSCVLLQQELFPFSPMQLQLVRLLLLLMQGCMGPEPGHHIFSAGVS